MAGKRTLNFSPSSQTKKSRASSSDSSIELSPSQISSPETSASVKGIVTSLSPSKPSNVFFGELSDGDSSIPLIGFDKSHRDFLEAHMDTELPISIKNCQISINKTTKKLQLVVKSYTMLEQSDDKDLQLPDKATLGSPLLSINELITKKQYDRVTVRITALKVKDVVTVKNKQKQEVIVGDDSGTTTFTLWESNIGKMVENKSYQLNRVQVHQFLGKYELNFPLFGASIEEIDDLPDVSPFEPSTETLTTIEHVSIVGVSKLELSFSCISCKNLLVSQPSELVECQHCETKQKLRNPKISTKLFIVDGNEQQYSLRAHNDSLLQITGHTETNLINIDDLFSSPPFDVTFDQYHVITNISRK